LIWIAAGGVACDDACGGDQYWGDPDAWQWTALRALGALGVLAGIIFAVVGRGDRRSAARRFALVVTLALIASPWLLHNTR
jgi:hypothetical protein